MATTVTPTGGISVTFDGGESQQQNRSMSTLVNESEIFNVLRDISELDLESYNSLVLAQQKVVGEIFEAPHHQKIRELFSES